MNTHSAAVLGGLLLIASVASAQAPTDPTTPRYEGVSTLVAEALGEPMPAVLPGPLPLEPTAPDTALDILALPPLPDPADAIAELPLTVGVAASDTLHSPVDTLQMSLWERAWWGSGGVMRATGLFPLHPDDPTADLRQIATTRRRMLSLHQVLGFATVASLTATVVGGQIALNGGGSGLHKASLPFTIGLYATTATLALASPPKLVPNRGGFDSITLHRYLAVAHVAGMIVTPLLAPEFEDGEGDAQTHQLFGYATLGTLTAAMVVATFLR